jgi:predicted alpha/beta superfamily hydrolase
MAAIVSALAVLLGLLSLGASAADAVPALRAREVSESTLTSAKGSEYRILVSAPTGTPPQRGFPVIYVLDGDAWFAAAVEIAKMREYQKLTPAIIVGVGYPGRRFFDLRRSYDYTPPGSVDAEMKQAGIALGGADEFLAFLNQKLKPWVRSRHRVDPDAEILFGHSFGGLFALHTLFTAPDSFDVYLAASPSILFSSHIVLKQEAAFLANPKRSAVRVLLSAGELEYPKISEPLKDDYRRYYAAHPESIPGQTPQQAADELFASRPDDGNASMAGDARALAERLSKAGVQATFAYFPGEEHLSAAISALNRGIPFALRPLQ